MDFLNDKSHVFYLLLGGYGSGKSHHAALKLVLILLSEKRTALVVREVYATLRDSSYAVIMEILEQLGLGESVKVTASPLQIRFGNGSKIVFRGLDKPQKLKSIQDISIVWAEECAELKYEGFKEVLARLRHPQLPLYFILTTNPTGKGSWVYRHFFYNRDTDTKRLDDELLYEKKIIRLGDTYYHHSTVEDNPFLPETYRKQLDDMALYDKDLYQVARLGRFGQSGLLVLPQFTVMPHADVMERVNRCTVYRVGMDFGFETSYNAVIRVAVDEKEAALYIYWEYYHNHMTDDRTAQALAGLIRPEETIWADAAEPKTIQYYRQRGFRMRAATKFPGSRLANIKKIKRFHKIVCSDACVNAVRELEGLTYARSKDGEIIPDQFTTDPHTFSAVWYALNGYEPRGTGVLCRS